MSEALKIGDCINETGPWPGKPVAADSLTRYRGGGIGLCNPGCRDKFGKAASLFDRLIEKDR